MSKSDKHTKYISNKINKNLTLHDFLQIKCADIYRTVVWIDVRRKSS